MKTGIGGFEMQIAAEPSLVVAVLGGAFPYRQSWLEKMARELADSLGLDKREEMPTTLYFDNSMLVGAREFSARGSRKARLMKAFL